MTELTREQVKYLSIEVFYDKKKRSSFCWNYFGNLISTEHNTRKIVNPSQVYCLVCLTKEKEDTFVTGPVKIKKYNRTVSTGNMIRHLRDDHCIVDDEPKVENKNEKETKKTKPKTIEIIDVIMEIKQENARLESDEETTYNTGEAMELSKLEPTETWGLFKNDNMGRMSQSQTVEIESKGNLKLYESRATQTRGKSKHGHYNWQLAKDLALWFCKSLLPFDYMCDEAMVEFIKKYKVISNEDSIPSSHIVSGPALSELYETMFETLKEAVDTDGAQHVAMAIDIWTDQFRRLDYIKFALHYLTSDFNLKVLTLNTEIIMDGITSEKIMNAIERTKELFNLSGHQIIAVSNAETHVGHAIEFANMANHLCLGHSLHNLITVDGIGSVTEIAALVQKCKVILIAVKYRSPDLQINEMKTLQLEFFNRLDSIVQAINADEMDPIPQVDVPVDSVSRNEDSILPSESTSFNPIPNSNSTTPTRWNIILEMLEIITFCIIPLNNMLRIIGRGELEISQTEWTHLEEILKFLKNFREAIQILSLQKSCTLNVALVFRSELIDVLKTSQDTLLGDSSVMTRLKNNMLANLNRRFPVTKAMVASALLDNRFVGLKEIDNYLASQNLSRSSFLSNYIKEIIDVNDCLEITMDTCEQSVSNDESSDTDALLQKLSKKHCADGNQGLVDKIEQECWRFIAAADPSEPRHGDLLTFWNKKKDMFPHLAALAKALLCIPATSVPSEKMFSESGWNIAEKRSRLNPSTVNRMIFIHDNYKICNLENL